MTDNAFTRSAGIAAYNDAVAAAHATYASVRDAYAAALCAAVDTYDDACAAARATLAASEVAFASEDASKNTHTAYDAAAERKM